LLLSKSILRPIADLQRATEAVGEGRYEGMVPVTTGDELGELAASFNQMVAGLRERERIREAFGTYLDREVAEYILSEGFTEEGVELEVSILFCDVQNFTAFAARSDAAEVVSRLNEMFETVVPIIGREGGHVDKFIGDGLIAVFGAPEPYRDHADRAVRAAVEMASRVNGEDGGAGDQGFRVGIGVNTGRVIAGAIGGAGRLNFSVIGDPVNVAARVEHATRETGDDVLITTATAERLSGDLEFEERGPMTLRGKDQAVKLYAPKIPAAVPAREGDGHAEGIGAPPDRELRTPTGGRLGARPSRTHTLPGS
jgi:class 3 adenylate cyclase